MLMTLTTDNCAMTLTYKLAEAILAAVTEYESKRLGYPVSLTAQQKWLALEQARLMGEFPDFNS